jgi:hypothetical protein
MPMLSLGGVRFGKKRSGASPLDDMLIVVTPGTAASTSSTTSIPASNDALRLYIVISTPYNNSATFACGNGANGSLLLTAGFIDPTRALVGGVPWVYDIATPVNWGTAGPVVVTIGGGPTVGASVWYITYGVPQT